jgi:long-chain acyl-CoA synthetase
MVTPMLVEGGSFLGHRPVVDGVAQAFVWQSYTQVLDRVTNFGAGLSHLGLVPKRNFGIFSVNRPEWV